MKVCVIHISTLFSGNTSYLAVAWCIQQVEFKCWSNSYFLPFKNRKKAIQDPYSPVFCSENRQKQILADDYKNESPMTSFIPSVIKWGLSNQDVVPVYLLILGIFLL